ncbi:MAG: acyl-CoA dehydrogenase [Hyphomicrobiaceae bacterium]
MSGGWISAIAVVALFVLAMWRAPLVGWSATALTIALASLLVGGSVLGWTLIPFVIGVVTGLLAVKSIRDAVLIKPAFAALRGVLPSVSDTEQQALDAGTVGWDAELFSGTPDWIKLRAVPPIVLTPEERAFLDGPTEELCRMVDDWQIRHNEREIPEPIWRFVAENGFLGMLISKEHGGLGFSAQAQSLILGKISSRSPDVATIVMVPNSLGPGELIEKYGTLDQKEHYLPRLAKGQEIPCFGLTGPTSGSDAATMRDIGTVARGLHDGKETVGIRLSWEKRYITLGPKATLLGLAFRLFDPEELLGKGKDVGITLALVPTDHAGVNIGRRHLPSGSAFPNGPNWGEDVFIPVEWIIGGKEMAGQGWRMLMECLSAGRSISLPSSSAAGAKTMLRVTSAYARIRRQFGIPVSRMEGIEEPMARLVEHAYVTEAARAATSAMVARGEKPSVISALLKYQSTERMRDCVNAAMDIHGGRGICDGPANYLQSAYQMVPVAITVEGANILSRSLITFAQGALRSHPYLYSEIQAMQDPDKVAGLAAFEKAFLGHVGFAVSNVLGALFHNLTLGTFASAPSGAGATARWYRQLASQSRNFALVADLTVATLGGGLKTRQKITGRMADALSELYLLSCVLKRYEDDGRPSVDLPVLRMAAENALYRCEQALRGTIDNFPILPVRWLMRWVVFPLGSHYRPASDRTTRAAVALVLEPGEARDRLTREIFVSKDANDPTGILEHTLAKVVAAEDAQRKIERAVRKGEIRRYHGIDWIGEALQKGIVTGTEATLVREVEELTNRVIAVDHFDPEEVKPHYRTISNTTTGLAATRAAP